VTEIPLALVVAFLAGLLTRAVLISYPKLGKLTVVLFSILLLWVEIRDGVTWFSWWCFVTYVLGLVLPACLLGRRLEGRALGTLLLSATVPWTWKLIFADDAVDSLYRESLVFLLIRLVSVCAVVFSALGCLRLVRPLSEMVLVCHRAILATMLMIFFCACEIGYRLSNYMWHDDSYLLVFSFWEAVSAMFVVWSHAVLHVFVFLLFFPIEAFDGVGLRSLFGLGDRGERDRTQYVSLGPDMERSTFTKPTDRRMIR